MTKAQHIEKLVGKQWIGEQCIGGEGYAEDIVVYYRSSSHSKDRSVPFPEAYSVNIKVGDSDIIVMGMAQAQSLARCISEIWDEVRPQFYPFDENGEPALGGM